MVTAACAWTNFICYALPRNAEKRASHIGVYVLVNGHFGNNAGILCKLRFDLQLHRWLQPSNELGQSEGFSGRNVDVIVTAIRAPTTAGNIKFKWFCCRMLMPTEN